MPVTGDRCNTPGDANWVARTCGARTSGTSCCRAAHLNGILGDPSQTDNLYETGLRPPRRHRRAVPVVRRLHRLQRRAEHRLLAGRALRQRLPRPADHQLRLADRHHDRRPERLVGGQRLGAPDPNNPWAGSHAAPQFGAIPYVWPMAGQTQTLLQSLVAPGLESSTSATRSSTTRPCSTSAGASPTRGSPPGRPSRSNNLTSSYNETPGAVAPTACGSAHRVGRATRFVEVSLSGQAAGRRRAGPVAGVRRRWRAARQRRQL